MILNLKVDIASQFVVDFKTGEKLRRVAAENTFDFSFGAMKFIVDIFFTLPAYEGAESLFKELRRYLRSSIAMRRPDLMFTVHATRKFKTYVLSSWLRDLLIIFSSFKAEGKRPSVASFFSLEGKALVQQVFVHAACLFEYVINCIPSSETKGRLTVVFYVFKRNRGPLNGGKGALILWKFLEYAAFQRKPRCSQ